MTSLMKISGSAIGQSFKSHCDKEGNQFVNALVQLRKVDMEKYGVMIKMWDFCNYLMSLATH